MGEYCDPRSMHGVGDAGWLSGNLVSVPFLRSEFWVTPCHRSELREVAPRYGVTTERGKRQDNRPPSHSTSPLTPQAREAADSFNQPHIRRPGRKLPFLFSRPRSGSDSLCQHPRWPPTSPSHTVPVNRVEVGVNPEVAQLGHGGVGGVASGGPRL